MIKSYVREENEIEHFTQLSDDYLERNMEKVKIQAWFMPLLFLITGVSVIIVMWVGGSMVIKEDDDAWRNNCIYCISKFIHLAGYCFWMGNKYYSASFSKYEKIT